MNELSDVTRSHTLESLSPLLESDSEVIEQHAVGQKTLVVRSENRNKLRRQIDDLTQLRLSFSDHRLCPVSLGNVGHRSHELDIIRVVAQDVRRNAEIPHGTVG